MLGSSTFLLAIALSVLGLLVGPALFLWARGARTTLAALDGATLGFMPALILLLFLPHIVEDTGPWALVVFAASYIAFAIFEAKTHHHPHPPDGPHPDPHHDIGALVVLPALTLHSFLDGAGLAVAFESREAIGPGALALGAAIVLHKIPEGLFVTTIWAPSVGFKRAWWRLLALALATVLGAITGIEFFSETADTTMHLIVAAGLGVMLRMAVHRHGTEPERPIDHLSSGLGFLGAIAIVLAIPAFRDILTETHITPYSIFGVTLSLLAYLSPLVLLTLLLAPLRYALPTIHHQALHLIPSLLIGATFSGIFLSFWTPHDIEGGGALLLLVILASAWVLQIEWPGLLIITFAHLITGFPAWAPLGFFLTATMMAFRTPKHRFLTAPAMAAGAYLLSRLLPTAPNAPSALLTAPIPQPLLLTTGLVLALGLLLLLRAGPRGFFTCWTHPVGSHDHSHSHDHPPLSQPEPFT